MTQFTIEYEDTWGIGDFIAPVKHQQYQARITKREKINDSPRRYKYTIEYKDGDSPEQYFYEELKRAFLIDADAANMRASFSTATGHNLLKKELERFKKAVDPSRGMSFCGLIPDGMDTYHLVIMDDVVETLTTKLEYYINLEFDTFCLESRRKIFMIKVLWPEEKKRITYAPIIALNTNNISIDNILGI